MPRISTSPTTSLAATRPRAMRLLGLAALACLIAGCCPKMLDDGTPVAWPKSQAYRNKLAQFELKPDQAYRLALEAATRRGQTVLLEQPLLIIGEHYLFGVPGERGVWLTGYYVHGLSGEVEFRKVDRMLYCGLAGDPLRS